MRAAFGNYPHDCITCQTDEHVRQSWGCTEDAPHAIDRRPCHCGNIAQCPQCHGTGFVELKRCPYKIIPANIQHTLRYAALAREGLWPEPGGAMDQSQSFLDAMSIINREIKDLEEARAQ